jgi:hypothetical protein
MKKNRYIGFRFLHAHACICAVALFPPQMIRRRRRFFFIHVQPTRSVRVTSSPRCCPPDISLVTVDHDDLFEVPAIRGGG